MWDLHLEDLFLGGVEANFGVLGEAEQLAKHYEVVRILPRTPTRRYLTAQGPCLQRTLQQSMTTKAIEEKRLTVNMVH